MPLIDEQTRGVMVIAVTPFSPDGSVDYDSVDRMCDFYYEKGADGLTILGIMGEAPKLTAEESRKVVERVIARSGDKPVVVGVSSPGIAALRDLSSAAMDMGAAGVMVAPPGSLKTDPQIVDYYATVAEALGGETPIVLQDFPLTTGVQLSNPALNAIVQGVPSVKMLKHEDWPGLAKITALRKAEAAGQRRISILCGNGGSFLPEECERGADGAMTGFGFPEMMVDVVRLVAEGNMERALDIFDAYLPMVRYEMQPGAGLAVRKHVLAKRGAIAHPTIRKPGGPLAPEAMREVDRMIARQEKRLAELG